MESPGTGLLPIWWNENVRRGGRKHEKSVDHAFCPQAGLVHVPELHGVHARIAWLPLSGVAVADRCISAIVQQRLPDLPRDKGGRQSVRSDPVQHHWKESGIAAELQLFKRNERRRLRLDEEKLDKFIAHPDEVVPDNAMRPYGGLASA